MIGDKAASSLLRQDIDALPIRTTINLNSVALKPNETPFTNWDCKYTNGVFSIRFRPISARKGNFKYAIKQPYFIRADILNEHGCIKVSGYEEMCEIAKENKSLAWLMKWTSLSDPAFFDLAIAHPNILFYFSADWIGYWKYLKEQSSSALFYEPNTAIVVNNCLEQYYIENIKKGSSNKQ